MQPGNKSRLDDSLIPDLMKEIEPYMVTDMTKDRYLDMALAFLKREPGLGIDADMVTLPGTAVETVIYDEYHPNQEEIMDNPDPGLVLQPVNEDRS